jgi:hypothetical protein
MGIPKLEALSRQMEGCTRRHGPETKKPIKVSEILTIRDTSAFRWLRPQEWLGLVARRPSSEPTLKLRQTPVLLKNVAP